VAAVVEAQAYLRIAWLKNNTWFLI